MSKIKTSNPPKNFTLTQQLRWHLENCGTTPHEVAKRIDIHHASLYRFLAGSRGLSDETADRLAKYLRLRLIRDKR